MPPRDSMANTVLVAFVLCFVCSLAVSLAAVGLKERQEKNKALDVKKNILDATGIARAETGDSARSLSEDEIKKLFANIEAKIVDIDSAEFVEMSAEEIEKFDPRDSKNERVAIGDTDYKIGKSEREKRTKIFVVRNSDNSLDQIVLPIYGNGLWSTLYGFLAIDKDLETVKGITFYEHAETPGLGGEVDNPRWKDQWLGLSLYGEDGAPAIGVNKGPAPMGSKHLVDGLSGATITSRGVNDLVRYWISDGGFKPMLDKLRSNPELIGGNASDG